jgi:hypothetical protein
MSKRDFDLLRDRVSQLESKVRSLEERVKGQDKKLEAKELYRIIKTEEKAREIEKSMGVTERPL